GAIAAFLAAVSVTSEADLGLGSVSLLITGDEEGEATGGTARVLPWLASRGEIADFFVVGEATNVESVGDTVKVGRRGSLNIDIEVRGVQGHVAYPDRVDNPLHRLALVLNDLISNPLDAGSALFEPSTLQITSVDTGNEARNVVPPSVRARVNIRFNDLHSGASLRDSITKRIAAHGGDIDLDFQHAAEPFATESSSRLRHLVSAVEGVTGRTPALDTGGGTSDARFISRFAEVAEFGLISKTIHQVNEAVEITDLALLTDVYATLLRTFLRAPSAFAREN
ncbi:MAG: succinyl-diaminopimelate desuccinylase, partial [Microbacterium arborescens]